MSEELSKKERRELYRQQHRESQEKNHRQQTIMKLGTIVIVLFIVLGGAFFIYKEFTKPAPVIPGKSFDSQGRDHVAQTEWEKFSYNSNPPTSGPHDPVWTQPGIYDSPRGVGHLVHSLEHGYIILYYNCAYGQSSQSVSTESAQIENATPSSEVWKSDACTTLKKQLAQIGEEKRLWKLLVVAWPTLPSRIAQAAWTRLDTFNDFDHNRIITFIDAYRDHGPEQTME